MRVGEHSVAVCARPFSYHSTVLAAEATCTSRLADVDVSVAAVASWYSAGCLAVDALVGFCSTRATAAQAGNAGFAAFPGFGLLLAPTEEHVLPKEMS